VLKKKLYDLALKVVSVKAIFFAVTLLLIYTRQLPAEYGFYAGALWVGARELSKHFLEK